MKHKRLKLGSVAVTACILPLISSSSALADSWTGDINGPGGGAAGTASVGAGGDAKINMTTIDTKRDGLCAQLRVIFDLPLFPDRSYDGPKVCGFQVGKTWKETIRESSTTNGIKLQMCKVDSDGSDRHCETKKYVSR
jgi:hypothetical protein